MDGELDIRIAVEGGDKPREVRELAGTVGSVPDDRVRDPALPPWPCEPWTIRRGRGRARSEPMGANERRMVDPPVTVGVIAVWQAAQPLEHAPRTLVSRLRPLDQLVATVDDESWTAGPATSRCANAYAA